MPQPSQADRSLKGTAGVRRRKPLTLLERAWVPIALFPVFVGVAMVVMMAVDGLVGVDPSTGVAPLWSQYLQLVLWVAVLFIPGVSGVVHGRRAERAGVRSGALPVLVGALLCVATVLLTLLLVLLSSLRLS